MPGDGWGMTKTGSEYDDEGSPARFFYCAKAGKADRQGTTHPTTKPISLISWLCRLICPPGGVILDCFAGSGSIIPAAVTQGFKVIAIEREEEYISDCLRRIEALKSAPRRPLQPAKRPAKAKPAPATLKAAQGFLFNFSEVAA
jgi:site-specific DNA-methyltransferase (adenine-specific)